MSTLSLKLYARSQPQFWLFLLAIIINLILWGYLAFNIHPKTEPIFLHYTALFGVDLVGAWYRLYFLPLGGLIIILLNFLLGWRLYQRDLFSGAVLAMVAVLGQIFLALAGIVLVFLNV